MCVSKAAVEQLRTDRPSDGGDGVYADELDSQQDLKTLPYIKSVKSLSVNLGVVQLGKRDPCWSCLHIGLL